MLCYSYGTDNYLGCTNSVNPTHLSTHECCGDVAIHGRLKLRQQRCSARPRFPFTDTVELLMNQLTLCRQSTSSTSSVEVSVVCSNIELHSNVAHKV